MTHEGRGGGSPLGERLLAYSFGVVAFVLPAAGYLLFVRWLGFPDGHLTELERAERTMWRVFAPLSTATGLFALYRGYFAPGRRGRRSLWIAVGLYALVLAAFLGIRHWLGLRLDDGAGG